MRSSATLHPGFPLRRLFSTFADGWPGAGLLIMRLVAGATLVVQGLGILRDGPAIEPAILGSLEIAVGGCLVAGFFTPIAAVLTVILEAWRAFSGGADPWSSLLLGTLGAALALLGPGAWSVDARRYGWKRIDVRDRKSSPQ
jgi:uncharacterized membrane protein YphA (DoxX/SURF4 family)